MILQRTSDIFLCFLVIGMLLVGLLFVDARVSRQSDHKMIMQRRELVRVLTLTDLCLFTEARYTRHPTLADLHTPLQDHPLALDHFPSGSLMKVPSHIHEGWDADK